VLSSPHAVISFPVMSMFQNLGRGIAQLSSAEDDAPQDGSESMVLVQSPSGFSETEPDPLLVGLMVRACSSGSPKTIAVIYLQASYPLITC
jgi:hypothetical protein